MLGDTPGWILPETVADVMLDLVQKEQYVGGSIVEVGEKVRVVQIYGDLGPKGGGNAVEHDPKEEVDMWASIERQYGGNGTRVKKLNNGAKGVNGRK